MWKHFLPHPQTHEKSHFLHWHAFLAYILIFITLRLGFNIYGFYQPGVLGVNSQITEEKVIELTNIERAKYNLPPVSNNPALANAAKLKAQNMYEENYWSHYSPSGKDPWGFITRSGYKFSYAGENLARNFQTSDEVVKAWMNSPSHKENVLNPNYQEIGIAVVDGVLMGQKTTLVVQEFGRPYDAIASLPKVDLGGTKVSLKPNNLENNEPPLVAGFSTNVPAALINPYSVTKAIAMFLIGFIGALLIIDFWVMKKRGVFRLASHHLAHLSFLGLTSVSLFTTHPGVIL